MDFPTVQDVLAIDDAIVARSEVVPGILNEGAIGSALERTIWGPFPYGVRLTVRAAFLLRGIVQDHPFVDGNKRTGWQTMRVFLLRNRVTLTCSPDEIVAFVLAVAQGHLSTTDIIHWLDHHAKSNTEAD